MPLALEFVSVDFAYDHGPLVLRGVDLDVGEHEVVSLIGASGSGKSTLLRCVNALEPIDGGTITLQGELVSGPKVDLDRHRRSVGIIFQSFNLFPHMTVLRNITLAPRQVLRLSSRHSARPGIFA
jgi:polar amino acid transport system ATP-binding protein